MIKEKVKATEIENEGLKSMLKELSLDAQEKCDQMDQLVKECVEFKAIAEDKSQQIMQVLKVSKELEYASSQKDSEIEKMAKEMHILKQKLEDDFFEDLSGDHK